MNPQLTISLCSQCAGRLPTLPHHDYRFQVVYPAEIVPAAKSGQWWGVMLWAESSLCLSIAAQLRAMTPSVRVLLVLPHHQAHTCQAAYQLDVSALLSATHLTEELPICLDKLGKGFRFASNRLPLSSPAHNPLAHLSQQERCVLKLMAQGFKVSDIAARLHLSASTVKTHKQHIVDKLSLPNQQALYMFIGEHKAAILDTPSYNGL